MKDEATTAPEPAALTDEPTDAEVETLARSLFARSKEGRDGWTWPIDSYHRDRDLEDARAILNRIREAGRKHELPALSDEPTDAELLSIAQTAQLAQPFGLNSFAPVLRAVWRDGAGRKHQRGER